MSTGSFNISGVLYDSDSEEAQFEGKSYQQLLHSEFNESGFNEVYLCRYLGKGPNLERLLLVIPSVSPKVLSNHSDSLRLIVKTFDPYLSGKYSLIICQTCVSWTDKESYYFVNQWYNMLPSVKKKNLLKVYLIHTPVSTKTFLTLSTPFNSSKSLGKIELMDSISNLFHKLELNKKNMLRHLPYIVQRTEEIALGFSRPLSPFNTDLSVLAMRVGQRFKDFKLIPPLLSKLLLLLESGEMVNTPNLLNLQCDAETLYRVVSSYEDLGENAKIATVQEAVTLFKLLLDLQPNGLLGTKSLTTVKNGVLEKQSLETISANVQGVTKKLPKETTDIAYCVVKTLRAIARNYKVNGMSVKMIGKVMAPAFFRPSGPDVFIYKVAMVCESITCNIVEKPALYFSLDKDTKLKATTTNSSSATVSTAASNGTKGGKGQNVPEVMSTQAVKPTTTNCE